MDLLNKLGNWAKQLTEVGVTLIGFGIVLEILSKVFRFHFGLTFQ